DLPRHAKARTYQVEVREAISGRGVALSVRGAALNGASLEAQKDEEPAAPRPVEVGEFLKKNRRVVIVPGKGLAEGAELAKEAQRALKGLGIEGRVAEEGSVYRQPTGDAKSEDPLGDGYHSWHSGQEVIAPGM